MAQSNKKAFRSAEGSYKAADKLAKQADDPAAKDDPRWLRRMARKVLSLAKKKEKGYTHKQNQKKNRND